MPGYGKTSPCSDDGDGETSGGGIAAAFRAAAAVSLPVLAGYLFLGSAYGVLMNDIGHGPLWTAAMSVLVFGGTIQFIAISLLTGGFQPLHAFLISAMVNARHLFYGVSMLERYSGTGWKKPFLAFWLTDETFSLLCSDTVPPGVDKNWFRFFVSGLDYLYWIAGGLVGNIAGNMFAFNSKGIDFVMTALFTVIVLEQWRNATTHAPAVIGFAASAAGLALFGPAHFIVPAMLLIVAALLLGRRRLEASVRGGDGAACGGSGRLSAARNHEP